jgi:hypothetical protein
MADCVSRSTRKGGRGGKSGQGARRDGGRVRGRSRSELRRCGLDWAGEGGQVEQGRSRGPARPKGSARSTRSAGRTGAEGFQGPAGPPGANGAPGPPGPQGPPGVQTVKGYELSGTIGPGAIDGISASCPAGEGIISGGAFASLGYIFLDRRVGNGWGIGVDNSDFALTANVTVYLYCAPGAVAAGVEPSASMKSQIAAYRAARG